MPTVFSEKLDLQMKMWGVVVLVLAMSGCANMTEQQKNAAIGAGIGATAGAVMTKGSVLGAATGAVLGGIIGNETRRSITPP